MLIEGSGMEGSCLSYPQPEENFEYTWERRGDDELEAHSVTYSASSLKIMRREDCNEIVVKWFQKDVEYATMTYFRGKVCAFIDCPPDVGNCVEYKTKWCDGEEAPPTCEGTEAP